MNSYYANNDNVSLKSEVQCSKVIISGLNITWTPDNNSVISGNLLIHNLRYAALENNWKQ